MFYEPKTLIIVYKDEMLANQMKKLIETKDDLTDGKVGTTDNSISVVVWTEKVWLANKKAGNINSKVLFLGNIKGVDKLIPVIDVKFDKHGIRYGWAGNQAVVYATPEEIKSIAGYYAFYQEMESLPVPKAVKDVVKPKLTPKQDDEMEEQIPVVAEETKKGFLAKGKGLAKKVGLSIGDAVADIGARTAVFSEENFKSKKLMERQMLFLYRKLRKRAKIVYNRLEIKNSITKERML